MTDYWLVIIRKLIKLRKFLMDDGKRSIYGYEIKFNSLWIQNIDKK